MRRIGVLVALLAAVGVVTAIPASAAENYAMVKGGFYTPNSHDLKDFASGFHGEAALGLGVAPNLAGEVGVGYFRTEHSGAKVSAVPFTATAKALLPLDAVQLYAGAGLGVYPSTLDRGGDTSTSTAFGYHVLMGGQADVTKNVFVGGEFKYLWATASFDSVDVRLDGYATTITVGLRF
jgi:opacity protein-like surface antigen